MENREIINRILQLKKAKNAIILAHYYQNSEVQAIADYIGDSYQHEYQNVLIISTANVQMKNGFYLFLCYLWSRK